jgi:hypothetical protein
MVKSTPSVATHDVSAPTIIEFLLDETGSMKRFWQQTINGFKDFIDEQRSQPGLCLFTLTKFDTSGFRTPYVDLDIHMVPYLTTDTFVPNAGTNLRDTILHRIDTRDRLLTTWDIQPRVLFVCMTDGEDNSSRNSVATVRDQISHAMENNRTFVYLGAHARSDQAARELGFPPGNIRCFEGARMQETMQELATATTAYRAASTTSEKFYT